MLEFIVQRDEVYDPVLVPDKTIQVNDKYEIWFYSEERLPQLSIRLFSYEAIPKCLGLLDTIALEESGVIQLQNENTLSLKGQGVFLAFIDTGINYEDPAFRDSAGDSRIFAMWDQTVTREGMEEAKEGIQVGRQDQFFYGRMYDQQEINLALKGEKPGEIISEKDEEGHGTFLASLAAGSEDLEKDFVGAAPETELLVVKLRQAGETLRGFYSVPKKVNAYSEADVMLGIAWAEEIAEQYQRPLVICMGLGNNNGNHNGGSALCDYLDSIAQKRHRAVVIATGNEAINQHHYLGKVESFLEPVQVEVNVEKAMAGFYLEIWDLAPENLAITIKSPTGEIRPVNGILTGGTNKYTLLYEKTEITVDFRSVGRESRDQLIFVNLKNVREGIWTILVYPQNIVNGVFHIWLPMENLLEGRVFFLNPNPDTTLTTPGDAKACISVGGYNMFTGGAFIESGRGFLSGGGGKPDFVAPSVNVSGKGVNGDYTTRTGTSIAAAITAGVCAQVLGWAVTDKNAVNINSVDIKNFLLRGCRRKKEREYPNTQEGFGELDLIESFEVLRRQ